MSALEPVQGEVFLRLICALAAGLIIGFERETHGRAAGFRTTTLASVAAATAMILSEFLFTSSISSTATWRPDPARLAAGILTGMGFLGGAAIVRQDNVVRGVTTAAVLWFVTILGLAFGSGNFALGGMGFFLALVILFVLPKFESFIRTDWYAIISVSMSSEGPSNSALISKIRESGAEVKKIETNIRVKESLKKLRIEIKLKRQDHILLSQEIVDSLASLQGVSQVKWIG